MSPPTFENLWPKTGWMSLIDDQEIPQQDIITEIYENYVKRSKDPSLQARYDLMDDTLRDLYMKYALLKEKAGSKKDIAEKKIKGIVHYLQCVEGYGLLLARIAAIFRSGFDPYWQLTRIASLTGALKDPYLIAHVEIFRYPRKYPLLCYRTIHHYNECEALKRNINLNIQRSHSFDFFNPQSPKFHKKTYYYALLNFHADLIKLIPIYMNLFYKHINDKSSEESSSSGYSEGASKPGPVSISQSSPVVTTTLPRSSPTFTKKTSSASSKQEHANLDINAKVFSKILLTEASNWVVSELDKLKKWNSEKYFPAIKKEGKIEFSIFPHKDDAILKNTIHLLFAEKILFGWSHIEFDVFSVKPLKYPLSKHFCKRVVQHFKKKYDKDIEGNEKQHVTNQCKLAQALFKTPMTNVDFSHILISSFGESIKMRSSSKSRYHNSWETLFNPDTTVEKLSLIISEINSDLTMKCAELYQSLKPVDINKELSKYSIFNEGSPSNVTVEREEPLSNLYNKLSAIVIYHIIKADKRDNAVIFKRAIDLALEALKPPVMNLHSCQAIVAALQTRSVELCKVEPDETTKRKFDALKERFDLSKMNQRMRRFQITSEFPVIPYYGYIKQIFFHAIENDNHLEVVSLLNQMDKMKELLKFLDFGKKPQTDAVRGFRSFSQQLNLKKPPLKIEPSKEFKEKSLLTHEEWEEMPLDERLYYLATYENRKKSPIKKFFSGKRSSFE